MRQIFSGSPFGHPSMVQKASSPSSRQQRRAALAPMKINDAAASSSRSSPPPPPPHAFCLSSVCLLLLLSPQHLSPLHCPLYSSICPSIYFFNVSILAPPLPLLLLILASCTHTHTDTHACNPANIKYAQADTVRLEMERETRSHTVRMVSDWWPLKDRQPIRGRVFPVDVFLCDWNSSANPHAEGSLYRSNIHTVPEETHHLDIHLFAVQPGSPSWCMLGDVVSPEYTRVVICKQEWLHHSGY